MHFPSAIFHYRATIKHDSPNTKTTEGEVEDECTYQNLCCDVCVCVCVRDSNGNTAPLTHKEKSASRHARFANGSVPVCLFVPPLYRDRAERIPVCMEEPARL